MAIQNIEIIVFTNSNSQNKIFTSYVANNSLLMLFIHDVNIAFVCYVPLCDFDFATDVFLIPIA